MLNKKIIFVYGPTASGKTELVDMLAQHISIEVINMDAAQFYTPLSIGTAKPDWKSTSFKQHLFDCIDIPRAITVCEYYQKVASLLPAIRSRGSVPVLVGGSGFYLKSVLFPIKSINDNIVVRDVITRDNSNIWQELNEIDTDRAREIHPNDLYRIRRALHVWYTTGIKPSLYKPEYNPIDNYTLFITHRDKNELHQRIRERTGAMVQAGWAREAERLIGTPWQDFIEQRGFIGYSNIIDYINKKNSLDQTLALIVQKTGHYARKQEAFGRMLTREINKNIEANGRQLCDEVIALDLTSADLGLYIKQLLHKLY